MWDTAVVRDAVDAVVGKWGAVARGAVAGGAVDAVRGSVRCRCERCR